MCVPTANLSKIVIFELLYENFIGFFPSVILKLVSFNPVISLDALSLTVTVIFLSSSYPNLSLSLVAVTVVLVFSGVSSLATIFSSTSSISLVRTTLSSALANTSLSAATSSLALTDPMLINRNIAIAINKT